MTEDLERLGRRLPPEVIRALADHLEHVTSTARSEVVMNHGPGGIVQAIRVTLVQTVLDVRARKGA